jgi:putative hydrolase of the HAD superfamily
VERPFQAVFFDFGGTLFSYKGIELGALDLVRRAAEHLGVRAELPKLDRVYQEASRAAYQAFARRSFYLYRDLFHETFRRFARSVGGRATQEYLDWFHEEQRLLLLNGCALRPDCIEILQAARGQGIHVAVVSNIDDDYLLPMIRRCGLKGVLDAWTSSEEAVSCKPDPGIFHHALRKAGATPESGLFVGDSPEQDVAGARGVGMTTVLIREPGSHPPGSGVGEAAEPHHVIESLSELAPILHNRRA